MIFHPLDRRGTGQQWQHLYTWWQQKFSGVTQSKEVVLDLSLCKTSKYRHVHGPCVDKIRLHCSLRLILQRQNSEDENALKVDDCRDRSAMESAFTSGDTA